MLLRWLYIMVVFLSWQITLVAQTGEAVPVEQFPYGISWKIIKGEHYEIVYAEGYHREASEALHLLEKQHAALVADYGKGFPKITIVLNHTSPISNGFVALAPWRSLLYLFPPPMPELSGSDWLTLLALHEARHMVQMGALRQSTVRLFYWAMGENGWTLAFMSGVPFWFSEGDAVVTETKLTPSGRGRSPRFGRQTRALWLNNFKPSYSQAFLRSYDIFYADHYELGYLLTRYLQTKYGSKSARQALEYVSHFPHPWRFSGALEKITGKDVDEFYEEALAYYVNIWQRQQEGLQETAMTKLRQPPADGWLSYEHPQYDRAGNLYAFKYSFDTIPEVVRLDGQQDVSLLQPGILYNDFVFIDSEGNPLWSEYRPHPRYKMVGYSHVNQKTFWQLSPNENTPRAVLSPDNQLAAVLAIQPSGKQEIRVFAASGKLLYTVEHGWEQLQSQRFSIDGRYLDYIVVSPRGRALWQLDLQTGLKKNLIAASGIAIADPHGDTNFVYYATPYNGIEGIWRLNRASGQQFQVVEHSLGAFQPSLSLDGEKLAFNYYTVYGHGIGEVSLKQINPIPQAKVVNREDGLADFAASSTPLPAIGDYGQLFEESDYSHVKAAFNVHSWLPLYEVNPTHIGLQITSDNILTSLGWRVGYLHNLNESTHYGFGLLQYASLWPVFTAEVGHGNRVVNALDAQDKKTLLTWQETSAKLSSSLPLGWLFGPWRLAVKPMVQIRHVELNWDPLLIPQAATPAFTGNILPLLAQIDFSLLQRMAFRNLQPRWGVTFFLLAQENLTTNRKANQQALGTTLYLPGLWYNHGLSLSGGWEQQKGNEDYLFAYIRRFARGYEALLATDAIHTSANYIFPLFYPDWNILHVLYWRRVKANFFFDRSILNQNLYYDSTGVELTVDVIPFKLNLFEVDGGVRYSRLLRTNQDSWEVFLRAFGPAM